MPSFESICEVLASLAAALVIALAAFGFGRPLVRRLALSEADLLATAVWSMALGFLTVGTLLLAFAWAGWLHPAVIAAITLAGGLWSAVELACVYLGWIGPRVIVCCPTGQPDAGPWPVSPGAKLVTALAAVILVASLIAALAPPTSPEALSSSLETPKNVLLDHGASTPWRERATITNVTQTWTLWALALDGPVAANLVHWQIGLLAALATALLARVFLPAADAHLAACLAVACPGVQRQLGVPLADLALALFATLALVAVFRVLVHLETSRWPIAAGLALGAAVAAHLAGLLLAIAVAAVWAYACRSRPSAGSARTTAAGAIALLAMLVAGPWLAACGWHDRGGVPQSWHSALAHLGPVLSLAVTALVFARRLRGLNLLVGLLAMYAVLAVAFPIALGRWWSVLVAPASVVAAWAWRETGRFPRPARRAASCILAALLIAPAAWRLFAAADSLAVATGWQSRGDFLLAREPTYRAASLFNRISRPGDRLLGQDARMFYFDCPTQWRPADGRQQADAANANRDQPASALFGDGGFTYLLLAQVVDDASAQPRHADGVRDDARDVIASALEFSPFGEVIPILEYCFADDNNRSIRYRLLRLAGGHDSRR